MKLKDETAPLDIDAARARERAAIREPAAVEDDEYVLKIAMPVVRQYDGGKTYEAGYLSKGPDDPPPSEFAAAVQARYTSAFIRQLTDEGRPLLAAMPREEKLFRGTHLHFAAWSGATGRAIVNFCIDRQDWAPAIFVSNGVVQMEAVFVEIDAQVRNIGRHLSRSVFGHESSVLPLTEWLPAAAPMAGENFLGVDRAVDPMRLAGDRVYVSGLSPLEGVEFVESRLNREGAGLKSTWVVPEEPAKWLLQELTHSFISGKFTGKTTTPDKTGFTVEYDVPYGHREIRILIDPDCPEEHGWRLELDAFRLYSCGPAPMVTVRPDDSVAVTFSGNTVLENPGHCAHIMF
jgi:hypothetical protein